MTHGDSSCACGTQPTGRATPPLAGGTGPTLLTLSAGATAVCPEGAGFVISVPTIVEYIMIGAIVCRQHPERRQVSALQGGAVQLVTPRLCDSAAQ